MDWIRYRIEDAKTTRATTLDLRLPWGYGGSEDYLRQVPPEILEMDWLEELNLSGHRLEGLPETLGRLSRLKTLNLSNNDGIRLGPELADLPMLERLDLVGARKSDARSLPWGKLTALRHLDLQLSGLEPDPALAALATLRGLHLDGDAPPWLADMGLEDLAVTSILWRLHRYHRHSLVRHGQADAG
jgi:internalin A